MGDRMIIYHIEKKVGTEWRDICLPTEDEELARNICRMKASKDSTMIRVVSDGHVVCLMSAGEWG